jgi:PleD family two-component response regulator
MGTPQLPALCPVSRYDSPVLSPCSTYPARSYTSPMGTDVPVPVEPRKVGILVVDDDAPGSSAIRQILDSEGWRVRVVSDTRLLLAELKTGEWSLVIANVALTGLDTPTFITLREISSVSPEDGGRIRVLYLVPQMTGSQFIGALEMARIPYVVRPYHLHDFLEKVSDLLVEVKAIEAPLRQVRHEFGAIQKKKRQAARSTSMFASRDTYSYTEEELAEYEREEAESAKNKRPRNRTNLGDPHS